MVSGGKLTLLSLLVVVLTIRTSSTNRLGGAKIESCVEELSRMCAGFAIPAELALIERKLRQANPSLANLSIVKLMHDKRANLEISNPIRAKERQAFADKMAQFFDTFRAYQVSTDCNSKLLDLHPDNPKYDTLVAHKHKDLDRLYGLVYLALIFGTDHAEYN